MLGGPWQFSGTVGVESKRILMKALSLRFNIVNSHISNDLWLSFNNEDWLRLPKNGGTFSEEIAVDKFYIKGSAAGTSYEGVATI